MKKKNIPLYLEIEMANYDLSIYDSSDPSNEEVLNNEFFNSLEIGKTFILSDNNYKVVNFEISLDENRNKFRIYVEEIKL